MAHSAPIKEVPTEQLSPVAGEEVISEEAEEAEETDETNETTLNSVYYNMKQYGTSGATSMQRILPSINIEAVSRLELSDEDAAAVDYFLGRCDLSDQPFEGDMTDDLFLAHRQESQLVLLQRRKRRRTLEMMVNLPSAQELQDDLKELQDAEDAESETSVVELESATFIDENGEDTSVKLIQYDRPWVGRSCEANCVLKGWDKATAATVPIDLSQLSLVERPESAAASVYTSLPVNHIRVFEIHPGEADDLISGTLHTLDLATDAAYAHRAQDDGAGDEKSKYEALSYYWGSPELICPISCNDLAIKIPRNVYSAIRYLRYPNKPHFLWIDALCINQLDNDDRENQVRQMMKIYKRASRVIVWLGGLTPEDNRAATTLMRLLDQLHLRGAMVGPKHDVECMQNLSHAHRVLEELYTQPWFCRTWIRQELVAARKVMVRCGNEAVSWAMLKRSSQRLHLVHKLLGDSGVVDRPDKSSSHSTLGYLKRGWLYGQSAMGIVAVSGSWYYWQGGGLLDLLMVGTRYDVTDPRDRVYAVLGMAREPIEGSFDDGDALLPYLDHGEVLNRMTVDYDSSVSEVYQRLAKTLINRDLNLDVLCVLKGQRQGGADVEGSDLPSWTPDWRLRQLGEMSDYLTLRFFASGYTRAERQLHSESGRLRVKAYAVDRVKKLLNVTATAWNLLYERGEAIILSNGAMENRKEWRPQPVFEEFDPSRHWRRCCKTIRGHIALVPQGAQPCDIIFVLLGARLPFILRSTAEQDIPATLEAAGLTLGVDVAEATVVGPCCVPDFMQGEVFSMVGRKEALSLTLV